MNKHNCSIDYIMLDLDETRAQQTAILDKCTIIDIRDEDKSWEDDVIRAEEVAGIIAYNRLVKYQLKLIGERAVNTNIDSNDFHLLNCLYTQYHYMVQVTSKYL